MSFATINLEAGFPSVDDARRRLVSEMQSARARGVRVIKVVHGWGSSGEGGTLGPVEFQSNQGTGRETRCHLQSVRRVRQSAQ